MNSGEWWQEVIRGDWSLVANGCVRFLLVTVSDGEREAEEIWVFKEQMHCERKGRAT